MGTLSDIRTHLDQNAPLQECFDRLLDLLQTRSDVSVGVSGSLASAEIDRYSDIDLEVIVHPGTDPDEVITWLKQEVPDTGQLVAAFPATHLGLSNLLIFFFRSGQDIVKADLWVMSAGDFARLDGAHLVVDPRETIEAQFRERQGSGPPPSPDFDDLFQKFVGWLWYTTTKIGRGERFEAYDSLHVIRTRVLVPCIQAVESLPFEGYRRAEARMSAERLRALQRTCATDTSEAELRRSLDEMVALFEDLQPEVIARRGLDHGRGPRLGAMKDALRREGHGL